jgi:hypothetical protein
MGYLSSQFVMSGLIARVNRNIRRYRSAAHLSLASTRELHRAAAGHVTLREALAESIRLVQV